MATKEEIMNISTKEVFNTMEWMFLNGEGSSVVTMEDIKRYRNENKDRKAIN